MCVVICGFSRCIVDALIRCVKFCICIGRGNDVEAELCADILVGMDWLTELSLIKLGKVGSPGGNYRVPISELEDGSIDGGMRQTAVSTAVNLASTDVTFSAKNLNDSVVLACKHSTTSSIDYILITFWTETEVPITIKQVKNLSSNIFYLVHKQQIHLSDS